jgi:hypothetical protein
MDGGRRQKNCPLRRGASARARDGAPHRPHVHYVRLTGRAGGVLESPAYPMTLVSNAQTSIEPSTFRWGTFPWAAGGWGETLSSPRPGGARRVQQAFPKAPPGAGLDGISPHRPVAKNDHFPRLGSLLGRPGGHFWQKTGVFGLRRPSGCGATTSLAAGTTSLDGGGTSVPRPGASLVGRATSIRRATTPVHGGTTAFRAPTTSVERPGWGPLPRNDVAASSNDVVPGSSDVAGRGNDGVPSHRFQTREVRR